MENAENIILEHLRAIRGDITTVKDDVRELKGRLANLEAGQATMMQQMGHQASVSAQQHVSYGRIIERVERIEKRLELQ